MDTSNYEAPSQNDTIHFDRPQMQACRSCGALAYLTPGGLCPACVQKISKINKASKRRNSKWNTMKPGKQAAIIISIACICVILYGGLGALGNYAYSKIHSNPSVLVVNNAETYISTHYSDFSGSHFNAKPTVTAMDNNVYKVDGTMNDKGGWSHNVMIEIQMSPNSQQYLVCNLNIDGSQLEFNHPRT